MFSLSHRTKHAQYQREDWAVRHFRHSHAFVIGGGTDFIIREGFDRRDDNISGFGNYSGTFKGPPAMNVSDCQRYLCGGHLFRVVELEVYVISSD